jgi:RNA polymerase sigma factor (sigma-70 family)
MRKLGDLVVIYKNGEKEALMEIVNIFKPVINKFKRNSYCEDMDSELILFMITLLEKMPMREEFLKDEKVVFSYIFKSLKNKYIRVNKKHYIQYNRELPNEEIFNYKEYYSLESNVEFHDMIKDLSDCEKNILNKRYIYNLTESDIARELKTSRQYINKVHKKALTKLRTTHNKHLIN